MSATEPRNGQNPSTAMEKNGTPNVGVSVGASGTSTASCRRGGTGSEEEAESVHGK